MSYHILHLLKPGLRVRLRLDQLHIADGETERSVPLADVAVIVAASPDMTVTAGALRKMAELNVLLLVCNEKFEPCALNVPYHRATNTELLRRQIEWTPTWKLEMWRRIIVAKVCNQAAVVKASKRAHAALAEIAQLCESEQAPTGEGRQMGRRPSLATIPAGERAGRHLADPYACESRAARVYWKYLLRRLGERQGTQEVRREAGTRSGVNGMLDYGYAILRTAMLRSLAAHGFIAAVGIAHAAKAGSFALADDLMEPLRPWVDRRLADFLKDGPRPMEEWIRDVVQILTEESKSAHGKVRLLNAIDLYVQSFAFAALLRKEATLKVPMLHGSVARAEDRTARATAFRSEDRAVHEEDSQPSRQQI